MVNHAPSVMHDFFFYVMHGFFLRTAHVRRTMLPAVHAVAVLTLRASVRLVTLGTGVLATLRALDGAAAVAVLFAHAEGA